MPGTDSVPFALDVSQTALHDLHERPGRTRLPAPLPGDGRDTGVPVASLRELVAAGGQPGRR